MKVPLNATSRLSGIGQYRSSLAKGMRKLLEQERYLCCELGWGKEVRVNPAFVSANKISNLYRCNNFIKKIIGFLHKFKCDQFLRSTFKTKT